ncbi:hypothetical protein NKG60_25060 [Mesorhizobium sp. M1428]|uniref:hypothetical protein n=1 Tax=unclassified Mesorhizobium TaxID=325217 RepID=UPI003337060F
MRRPGKLLRTALLPAASLLPFVASATEFPVTANGWTVAVAGRWCNASNRDPVEFAATPYNGLNFGRTRDWTGIVMRVFLWPGAVKDDMPVTATLLLGNADTPLEMTAMTTVDYIVDFDQALTTDEQKAVAGAGSMTVRVTGVEQPLVFRTEGLAEALVLLNECAKSIEQE